MCSTAKLLRLTDYRTGRYLEGAFQISIEIVLSLNLKVNYINLMLLLYVKCTTDFPKCRFLNGEGSSWYDGIVVDINWAHWRYWRDFLVKDLPINYLFNFWNEQHSFLVVVSLKGRALSQTQYCVLYIILKRWLHSFEGTGKTSLAILKFDTPIPRTKSSKFSIFSWSFDNILLKISFTRSLCPPCWTLQKLGKLKFTSVFMEMVAKQKKNFGKTEIFSKMECFRCFGSFGSPLNCRWSTCHSLLYHTSAQHVQVCAICGHVLTTHFPPVEKTYTQTRVTLCAKIQILIIMVFTEVCV